MKVSFGRGLLAALVVVAGAVAVFIWWSRNHTGAQISTTQDPARARVPHQIAQTPEANAKTPASATPDEPPPSDDFDDNPLANVLRPLLANDAQLSTFMYFHNRPLLDEASRARYHAFLSDPAMLANVKHDLLYPEEAKADQASNIKRLMKIDYLREALDWKDNPMRAEITSTVSEMLLTDNYPVDMGMDMRLSLSGNKAELYEILSQVAPDRATALLQSSKGTRLEPLLAHIATSLQNRKQIEAKLETEVTP